MKHQVLLAVPRSVRDRVPMVRLVAIECTASPKAALNPDDVDETIVLAQLPGEPVAELLERIRRAIHTVQRSGSELRDAYLCANSHVDAGARPDRLQIGKALLATQSGGQPLSALVIAAEATDSTVRNSLMDLVEVLVGESGGDRVPIRLCFLEPAPVARPSGIFPRQALDGSLHHKVGERSA